jgi:hypothetical protein
MTTHRILVYRVGEPGVVETIEDRLAAYQAIVGGYIETLGIGPGLSIFCNEEGWLNGMPPNRSFAVYDFNIVPPNDSALYTMLPKHQIHGPFFVARMDSHGNLRDITDDDIRRCNELFP